MEDYKRKYDQLKSEYESYQDNMENKLQRLTSENMELEKDITILSNIVQISNYINSFVSSNNIMANINDMIIGILGAFHSTVYVIEDKELVIKSTSLKSQIKYINHECFDLITNKREFVLNTEDPILICDDNDTQIYSVMGIPINIRDSSIGYIVVMHYVCDFFNDDHRVLLTAIASQIAVAIENSILYNEIQRAAKMDPLIGIYNRKTFFDIVNEEIEKNKSESYTVVMADFDNFKKLNDTSGHQFGDQVLIQTSCLIEEYLDDKDLFARYGGEELIIYLPNQGVDKNRTFNKINFIRESISNNTVRRGNIEKKITSSFGLGFYPDDGQSLDEVIKAADARLYKAKSSGKNRVCYTE